MLPIIPDLPYKGDSYEGVSSDCKASGIIL